MDLLHFSSLLFFLLPGQRTSIAGDVPAGDQVRGIGTGDLMKLAWLGYGNPTGIPGDFALRKVGIKDSENRHSNQLVKAVDFLVKSPVPEFFSVDDLLQKPGAVLLTQLNKGSTFEETGTGLVEVDEQLVLEGL